MAKAATNRWKNAERQLAKKLRDAGIPCIRKVSRAGNFAKKDFDAEVPGMPDKFDSKYRGQVWGHHGLLKTIEKKYCLKEGDRAILFTKAYREHSGAISLSIEDFATIYKGYLKSEGYDFDAGWKIVNAEMAARKGTEEEDDGDSKPNS